MKYISVETKPEVFDESHLKKLILFVPQYGEFLGFYDGEHFRINYATILENVTHYAELPERPQI